MPFIPHTDVEVQEMLATIGVHSTDDLFDEIPTHLKNTELKHIPTGLNEMETARLLQERAQENKKGLCFIGAGAYEHHIPAAVWDLTSRGEFMTAYTPYQAEASQGTLQLIYEYQTMMTSLTGMDYSNASLYDGASALAEAILMAVRANKQSKSARILITKTLHPFYRQTIQSIVTQQKIELIEISYGDHGNTPLTALEPWNQQDICALVIQHPNFFGSFEAVDQLTDWAHENNSLVIAVTNPIALGLIKEPGQWGQKGADIVCGEGQPLGIPLAGGGPYFGFMCCKKEWVRQMPGRIVGRTVDKTGKTGFTLTLQAREQHIRRAKATSNICTNQGLLVTAATIYMSLLGARGLKTVAQTAHHNAQKLAKQLTQIAGVELVFHSPFFHEFVIRLSKPVNTLLNDLAKIGIQGGFDLSALYPELGNTLLVCVTETKNQAELDFYQQQLLHLLTSHS
ncbi:probable glycine dehydrogenase (decarboxylating) subunit 1 [Candidatus Rickettsiella viridis]|uniref:Probable glycine dehydrogenase (decarboxylating) subunit 1 n=1 Tax=Candidatus Rickettsiella viridis TaxID=676208 RepID=A0A2Z5UTV6_9COXI|nr:aminomethyl-transferring glycine dehydrogenase subunit GcvPA [Candidatus Rickettsiella viridis]BBB14884.1 probable glycine dehydrogenase (decarboxylating) subunit 1 [Candidatus Rickettsiella viridis]